MFLVSSSIQNCAHLAKIWCFGHRVSTMDRADANMSLSTSFPRTPRSQSVLKVDCRTRGCQGLARRQSYQSVGRVYEAQVRLRIHRAQLLVLTFLVCLDISLELSLPPELLHPRYSAHGLLGSLRSSRTRAHHHRPSHATLRSTSTSTCACLNTTAIRLFRHSSPPVLCSHSGSRTRTTRTRLLSKSIATFGRVLVRSQDLLDLLVRHFMTTTTAYTTRTWYTSTPSKVASTSL